MLKQHWRFIARVERLGDTLIVITAFFIAYFGRASFLHWNEKLNWGLEFGGVNLAPIREYYVVLIVGLIGYSLSLNALGAYSSMRLSSSFQLLRTALTSSIIVFMSLSAIMFLLKLDLSRSFIVLYCLLVTLGLAAQRFLALEVLRHWRRQGKNFRNVIIAGSGEQALFLAESIIRRPELGIKVRGFALLRRPEDVSMDEREQFKEELRTVGVRNIGRLIIGHEAIDRALKEYAIDEMIFADMIDVMGEVRKMLHICAELGVRTTIAADLFSIGMKQSQMSYFAGMPLIHFQTPPGDHWLLAVKRLIDVVVSAALLLCLAPLFLLFALLVKLSSPGPVFFVQRRVGLNGRIFRLYKFRSMVDGAEKQLDKLRSKNEMNGPVFKMKRDPRVTGVGRYLRRFSLDELPQLWNVFIGDMSLVGPRPPVPGEVSLYERRDRRRLSMRPGITCTWQVSGRNEIADFRSWVKMDLEYIDNWSLLRDIWLLFRTVPAVIWGTGAR